MGDSGFEKITHDLFRDSLRQSSVAINWQDDKHAVLILSGQQQSDAYFEIDLEKLKPTITAESVTNGSDE